MSDQLAVDAAFEALGDPTRRRMLELLRGGAMPVGELAARLPVGRPAVSKHLRVLESAGLVEHRSRGTRNLYALAPDGLVGLQQWLVDVWDTALSSFADYVALEVTLDAPADGERTQVQQTRPARQPPPARQPRPAQQPRQGQGER